MTMRPEVRNRLSMLGELVAAELPAVSPGRRRWVGVYVAKPPHPNASSPAPRGKMRVLRFELDESLLDGSYSPFSGDLENTDSRWVDSMEELEGVLEEMGIDSGRLDAPWHCDYPL